jgi:flagellar hook protein FlgE
MSFDIALSGINAINTQLDTISNNIANADTTGFKSSRANFSALYAGLAPTGTAVYSESQSISLGGDAATTGSSMDGAISGAGFFMTKDTTGDTVYTRAGVFTQSAAGIIVDSFGRAVQGYQAIPGSTTLGALGNLTVPPGEISATPTTTLAYTANMSADWTVPVDGTFSTADPLSYNSSNVSVVYDSLGVQHSLTQYFVKTGTNAVTVNYALDGTALAATTPLTFTSSGVLSTPAVPVAIDCGTPTGALDLSVLVNYAGSTQFSGNATVSANAANGYTSGSLNSVALSNTGAFMASYSNGQTQSIGTVALATFPDVNGLVPIDDTSWTTSIASGTPLIGTPGTGASGTLTAGSIEESNVNLTSELVNLMTAQNNYQANSKVLQTESQMQQTLIQAL